MGLFTVPGSSIAKAKPAACDQEALVAVDVKALLRSPAGGPGIGFELGIAQLVPMRQNMTLNGDRSVIRFMVRDWRRPGLRGMPGHERVPWRDWTPVQN